MELDKGVMDRLYMYWYRLPDGQKNFGDELGPFLVSRISGKKIKYIIPSVRGIFKCYKDRFFFFPEKGRLTIFDILLLLLLRKKIILSVGSILGYFKLGNCSVWGSGIIRRKSQISKGEFYAVRGKYSQQRLRELGLKVPNVIGDPALLLPIVLPVVKRTEYKIGIIPHYTNFINFKKLNSFEKILIINPLDEIEKVVHDINSCEITISGSLHGIIVSHAYSIPCLWYKIGINKLTGDNIKFRDYFSSVAIEEYEPFELPNISDEPTFIQLVTSNFKANSQISIIQNDLKELQVELLKSAPFNILKKYNYS